MLKKTPRKPRAVKFPAVKKGLTMEEYIASYSRLNTLKPSTFIIRGQECTL